MAETTYNITLTANHQSLTAEHLPLAAESVQYLTAKVVCETEDWTGREIKAMFGRGCTVHEVSVIDGEITAKQQLNLTAGDWRVWLVGNSARDGDVIPRIITNIAHISVAPPGSTGMEAIYGVRPIPDDDGVYPYVYNMAAVAGMRVRENGETYVCMRDIDPLLYPPSQVTAYFTKE